MSNRKRILLALAVVATMFTVVVIGELFRNEPIKRTTPIAELDSPTTTTIAPTTTSSTTTTTTTVAPPTTTRPRPTTTTTTAPEPEVQGEAVVADGDDVEAWLAIGRCEQPGNEWGGVRWSHPGPTYQGGLGFWYGTWDSFKAGTSAEGIDNAGDATPAQQMEVARNIRARYGYRAWGCAKKVGLA